MSKKEVSYDGWLQGIICNRSTDMLRVLLELLDAGLSKGTVSALDIPDGVKAALPQPNVIGADFKLLPKLGFVATGERIRMPQSTTHRRFVSVYRLDEPAKARKFVSKARAQLLALMPPAPPPDAPTLVLESQQAGS
jgi:hypothetical protein